MPTAHPDWMAACSKQLQHLPLCQIPLPGSHDAGSFGASTATRSRTQYYEVNDQLFLGVRYFDFRVAVDNGVFMSHHGHDFSRDVKFAGVSHPWGGNWVFNEIANFCDDHSYEVVILNFTDFRGVPGQSFNPQDKLDFLGAIRSYFGSRLIPKPSTSSWTIPTYGPCVVAKQQVLVIVNDDDPMWTAQPDVWHAPYCWGDRFSDYNYDLHSWQTLVADTMGDQQDYLASPMVPNGRDLNRFWVSQAILHYTNATTPGGHSQNYAGAAHLNVPFGEAYKHWWIGQSAIPGKTQAVQRPNVLLMDYTATYGDFAQVCMDLLLAGP